MTNVRARHRSRSALLTALLATSLAVPAAQAAPATIAAGSIRAVFVDVLDDNGNHVLQTWTEPDATLSVTWDGDELIVDAHTDDPVLSQVIRMGPTLGESPAVQTYEAPAAGPNASTPFLVRTQGGIGGYICEGDSFTIHGISPVPQTGVATVIDAFSASFTQVCANLNVHGEIRWNSALGFSAVGDASDPQPIAGLVVPRAETFAGTYSALKSITLKNYGTEPLEFGTVELLGEAVDRWYIGVDECSNEIVAPGATCSLGLRAIDWIPDVYEDALTLPVSTGRGHVDIRLPSFIQAATFVPIQPVRLLDTRFNIGISGRLPNKAARTLTVVNRTPGDSTKNIPTTAVAVTGNLTITGQTSAGHAALTTSLHNNPTTATVNVPLGNTRGNAAIVRLTSGGTLGITWVGSAGSTTHAVFDATGYFIPSDPIGGPRDGNFSAGVQPFRVLDSRTGQGFSGALRPNVPKTFTLPLPGVWNESEAVAGNLVVVKPTGAGHIAIGPAPVTNPTTATVNFPAGDTRANNVIVKLGGPTGAKTLSVTYVGPPNTTAHVVFDVTGLFGPSGSLGYVPLEPSRVVDSRIGLGITTGRIQAGTSKWALIENRFPTDPTRNLPPDSSTGDLLFKHAVAGNATFVRPTSAGHLTVLGESPPFEPATATINSPAGDTRANGVIIRGGIVAAFWYEAPSGFTHVVFDVYGYFIQ